MMHEALALAPDIDAIFCANNDLAIGVLRTYLTTGMKVPEQVAILGFHGLETGQITTPRLFFDSNAAISSARLRY